MERMIELNTKRIINIKDEEAFVKLIIDFATEHRFTKVNILEAIDKVINYIDDNAIIEK